ncbi:unnamed protein product [Closterium sp. NIES-53]
MLLAPEGDPDASDIPTPRSYAEAITGPYSSLWQAAMDAEMASWKSTGTYVDEVLSPGANMLSGMWIFRVKRPPGSPPVFKARYVARGFSQRQGVDFFQTFSPSPKMTTLRGSLHEEIWLRRPPGFIGSFPAGTQWSLRRPVYGLRQAPREWHDTLRTTLAALDDLVFAIGDTEALAHVKSELQKRHTCTDLGELTSYLGLRITWDRAQRTITLTQSHMVQQVLQRFSFTYSSPQSTPLPTGHSLSAPPSDESVEPSGPYPELVGCLMYLMTCTRPDLAYPRSLLARYVAPGRHGEVHWDAAKRVLRYLCSTSGMGLVLGGRARVVLTGHADASWVGDLATQQSSQGYTLSLGSGSVSWRFTHSSSVLSSCCEAEIYAGAMAAQELRWLTYLLTDLGDRPRSPPVLYVDNKAMLALCQEHRLEHRTKHIALRCFLARELQQRGQLRLAYVASQASTAGFFTKALQPCDHQPCLAFLDWSCDLLFSPTLPMGLPSMCPSSLGTLPGGGSGGSGGGSGSSGGGSSGGGGGGGIGGGSGGSSGGGGGSGGSGGSGTGVHAGQTCGKLHTHHCFFSRLDDAWRADFGDDVKLPRWADLLKSRIAIFDLDFDAILSATYALSVSAEITITSTSACFFRYSTTLTPLSTPVPVRLADPSKGPVVACSSTVLPCLAVLSGSLSSLHLPSFSTNLVLASPATLACPALPSLRQRAAPHSSFPPTTAPLLTLHMDVWGPAHVSGQSRERYFLLVADDYTRYTTIFPLRSKDQVVDVLIPWIRTICLQLRERFGQDLPVPRLHSDRGGEFSSNLLREFCHGEGILQSFMLPDSPQQNGIAERRIGLVMEVARTSMIHAAAPHFLWPFAVWYGAHHLKLWPRVSLPETSLTLLWTGEVGDASVFRVWGSRAFVPDTSTDKLSPHAIPCVFLGFVLDAHGRQFYHPSSRHVFPSQDVTFDESVPFCRLFLYRSAPPPPPPLFLAPDPPPVDPLPPQGPAPSGVARGAASGGAEPRGAESEGAESGGAEPKGAETGGAAPRGVETGGGEPGSAEPKGVEPGGAASEGAESGGAEPQGAALSGGSAGAAPRQSLQQLREWFVRRARLRSGATAAGGTGAAGAGGAGVAPGAGVTGGTAATGPGGARTRGTGAAGTCGVEGAGAGDPTESGATQAGGSSTGGAGAGGPGVGGTGAGGAGVGGPGVGGAGAGGAGALDPGGAVRPRPYFVPLLQQVLGTPSSTSLTPPLLCPPTDQSQLPLQPASSLPAPSPYTEQFGGLIERREPASRPVSPVRTARHVPRSRPPPVPGTHAMTLCPSSVPLRVPLPAPPESSLPEIPEPESDRALVASPTVSCLLATAITDPSFESAAASALVAELLDFAAACRLDYATALVAESASASFPSVGGECALGTDVLEDRQEEFECLAAAVPRFTSMLLAPEGDLDAPEIPTPRSYAEAITGPYSSRCQAAMDAEMASWKSTGTYVDEVPPPRANIVDGMWIFRVKPSPGSPPAFKARFVARGFSQRQGVDYFQTFSPTPKMTTLRVLLQVAAQRDYELHSLHFSTAFLQGSQHEEIWMRRPHGFTESFPVGTQWSLRRPVYSLRQAPYEWHDTLRTTLAALEFAPSTADPSLFLRTDTLLPPFYVLVYVDDLVFATDDIEVVAHIKSELQKRHTCTDLGELRSYLGLQITRDRARRTITLTRSHMVHQSVEPSGPYPELVGCLMYLMTCTRPDLAYPLSLLAHYVAPGRHQNVHWDAAKRVLRYLCSTLGMRLVLGGRGPVVLSGHADASWVDDSATQRSSQGYTFSLSSGSVSWCSTRLSLVLSSSCEAEIYARAMAAQELCWLTYLLIDLGEQPRSPPVLYVDNKAMIALYGVSLFDYVSGTAVAPAADAPALERSQWQTRDAATRLAIRNHLPITERAHFSQHRTAKTLYDAVVARYSSPATAAIGQLMLPYLFPDLSSFRVARAPRLVATWPRSLVRRGQVCTPSPLRHAPPLCLPSCTRLLR